MNLPLNIDWQQILLHLLNFVILFAVLYFFLYKPVKDFMDKRTDYYKKIDDEAKANLENSEKIKEEYSAKLASVQDEISSLKDKAHKEIEKTNAVKIKQAENEAEKIITSARQAVDQERAQMLKEVQSEISEMVTTATEKIVLQSSTSESYEQFLSAVERGGENE